MGFYIRKAISFGPFRFNLSKGGIGVSVGVRGARIGTGPGGAYVHMGRHGLYYRQHLGGPEGHSGPPKVGPNQPAEPAPLPNVSALVDSSGDQVLSQINARISQTPASPFFLIGAALLAFLVAIWAVPVAVAIGFPGTVFAVHPDNEGVMHVKWEGLPRTEVVRSCLRPLILRGEIPNVEFDFEHVDPDSGHRPGPTERNSDTQNQKTDGRLKAAIKVLGIHEGATLQEVTHAYHKLALMYHPDKVASLGPEFRELAERRMKEINAAYEELKLRTQRS